MRSLRLTVRCFAVVVFIAYCAASAEAQSSCGNPDSIAVSIKTALDEHQMPLIVLSAKNISNHSLTGIGGFSLPRIHIEGAHGAPGKSTWYHQSILDYGYPGLTITLNVSDGRRYSPGETIVRQYDLESLYYVDTAGVYSVYMEVHDPDETCDPNAKWLRTNTVQLEITPDQVKTWEAKAGTPAVRATISMPQAVISRQQAPIIQLDFQNDHYTSYDGDDFFPHVERDSVEPAKTTYYRERLHEPGTRQYELWQGPKPDFPETSRKSDSVEAHQSSTWEIDLRNFYKFDTPGKYSVYVDFPDFSGKMLRSNTVEFEIAAPH